MSDKGELEKYSVMYANLIRMGDSNALSSLYQAILDEAHRGEKPVLQDLILCLEMMGKPNSNDKHGASFEGSQKDYEKVFSLIEAHMIFLEQNDFHQGVKSWHLNLQDRAPVNSLERMLKTKNFTDVIQILKKHRQKKS